MNVHLDSGGEQQLLFTVRTSQVTWTEIRVPVSISSTTFYILCLVKYFSLTDLFFLLLFKTDFNQIGTSLKP